MKMRLFSYCLRYDKGAAPNPFWDLCTLAICKPKIRQEANIGDWVVGLGSKDSPIGDIADCVVYAMQITDKMIFQEYDEFCQIHSPDKIPKWESKIFKERVGDCIYDYSQGKPPVLRPSVHDISNQEGDLSCENVLMSRHFYYFGNKPVHLPASLTPIVHNRPGYKLPQNEPYKDEFVTWIENLDYKPNKLHGEPQFQKKFILGGDISKCRCSRNRQDDKINKRSNC